MQLYCTYYTLSASKSGEVNNESVFKNTCQYLTSPATCMYTIHGTRLHMICTFSVYAYMYAYNVIRTLVCVRNRLVYEFGISAQSHDKRPISQVIEQRCGNCIYTCTPDTQTGVAKTCIPGTQLHVA